MPVILDPKNNEIHALLEYAGEIDDKSILEIGCGDGRLTRKYVDRAKRVIGIDPKNEKILAAEQSLLAELHAKVAFFPLDIEEYFHQVVQSGSHPRFDLILFSWSL